MRLCLLFFRRKNEKFYKFYLSFQNPLNEEVIGKLFLSNRKEEIEGASINQNQNLIQYFVEINTIFISAIFCNKKYIYIQFRIKITKNIYKINKYIA